MKKTPLSDAVEVALPHMTAASAPSSDPSSSKPLPSAPTSNNVSLPRPVYDALIDPRRALEVRGWIKRHPELAASWRGADGESMMHWAFLSDWVLAGELRDVGLGFDDKDDLDRYPMDWINDRLWAAMVNDATRHQLSAGGQERLRRHSEDIVRALWMQGARPAVPEGSVHPGVVWLRCGAFGLMDLLLLDNPQGWFHWTPRGGSALHAWVLAPDIPARRAFLQQWIEQGLSVDVPDHDGRTPLWYAIDSWLAAPDWRHHLQGVARDLLSAQASLTLRDADDVSPMSLLTRQASNDPAIVDLLNDLVPTWNEEALLADEEVSDGWGAAWAPAAPNAPPVNDET